MRRVALIIAMQAEADPLLASLRAEPVPSPSIASGLACRWYAARRRDLEVIVATNGPSRGHGVDGIGTVPAALTAFVTLRHWPVDLVISAGTAGGWARAGAAVGDVYLSRRHFVYHDRRIALPRFDAYGVGAFPAVDATALAQALQAKEGIVTTGNSLDASAEDLRMIASSGAEVKDMEAAAVAEVAHQLAVPVLAVKAITDLVDAHVDTGEQFAANLAEASRRLCETLVAMVDWCANHEVTELGGAAR